MQRLAVTLGLIAVFAIGSIAVIQSNGVDYRATAGTADSSMAPALSPDPRITMVKGNLYPDDVVLDDWLCDGMAPCIELSPRQPRATQTGTE
jgi:hypothetical protein